MSSHATSRNATLGTDHGSGRLGFVLLGLLWLTIVISSLLAMSRYEFSRGNDAAAPALWPEGSSIPCAAGIPSVIVFAHPRCPCTRATLEELADVLAKNEAAVKVTVLFFNPKDANEDWKHTATIRQASTMRGVTVLMDETGAEAQRFHAATSGRTLLYSASGQLLFDGGITISRGHAGENAGASALAALLAKTSSSYVSAPVFGCKILEPQSAPPCPR